MKALQLAEAGEGRSETAGVRKEAERTQRIAEEVAGKVASCGAVTCQTFDTANHISGQSHCKGMFYQFNKLEYACSLDVFTRPFHNTGQ